MPRLRSDKDAIDGEKAIGDAKGRGQLLPSGTRAGPAASFYNAWEAVIKRQMADEARSSDPDSLQRLDAALAAIHTYWAIYGDKIISDFEPLVDSIRKFWMDRFREGYPPPVWSWSAGDEKTTAPSEDPEQAPGPSKALEGDGR